MDKNLLRRELKILRGKLGKKEKASRDKIIKDRLLKESTYINSKVIFTYVGFDSEIDTIEYIKEFLKDGKKVCIPRTNIKEKYMEAVSINSLDLLSKSEYGILEPSCDLEPINKDEIDLIIMPGLAFDKQGGRLGYGGGYYDKYLSTISKDVPKIALAYDFQILEKIPMEEHDIKVDIIISDRK